MSTNPLFHKFLAEVQAAYTSCKGKTHKLTIQHLNNARDIAKRQDADRLDFDVEFWIESIKIHQTNRALIGMNKCIQIMENFKTLLDPAK